MKISKRDILEKVRKVEPQASERIVDVFMDYLEATTAGEKPSIKSLMQKNGYGKWMAKKPSKVTQSNTWQACLDTIPEAEILNKVVGIALDTTDKRAALEAASLTFKLKNRFPDKKLQVSVSDYLDEISD